MIENKAIFWINGKITAPENASISVFDHGFLYGDGVFEGIRFYHGVPFRLQDHLQRLQDSAQAISLNIPKNDIFIDAIKQSIEAFHKNSGYIRLIVTRGKGSLGINPNNCSSPTVIIIADDLTMIDNTTRKKGVRLITAATRKLTPDGLDPRIKSLNYLNHIMARIEANNADADEALMLNAHGHIAEGTADNVFIEKNGVLITPPTSDGALAGITRATIIELATSAGIQVYEKSIATYDVYTADSCFLTGTGAELIPVASVDGRKIPQCPSKIFKQLSTLFHKLIIKETST